LDWLGDDTSGIKVRAFCPAGGEKGSGLGADASRGKGGKMRRHFPFSALVGQGF